jgi:pimeloyl-ACP methyl ester carboxylesterase
MPDTLDLPPPRSEGAIRLRDGRAIGFVEYGTADGAAIFWFHGTPGGCRQIPPRARQLAVARGIRLIGLERPGVGASTAHLYDSVLGWAADVEQIADQLGVDRFALVGLSGGGPYVLACAHRLAERVVAGAVLGGVAPSRGVDAARGGAVGLARRLRLLLEAVREPLALTLWAATNAGRPVASRLFELFVSTMPEGDQVVMRRPEMKAMFLDDMLQAMRSQLCAPVYDATLFTRPWGFSPRDVTVPIRFWHGDADAIVPLAHAEHLATLVPDAELRVRPREGHMGSLDAAEEIFDILLELWRQRDARVKAG